MGKRYLTIWFRHLRTDWLTLRKPGMGKIPFVFAAPEHGRMVLTATNPLAEAEGVQVGMTVADARVLIPGLEALDEKPELAGKLLIALGQWCIRYAPFIAIDPPNGLIMDISGCAHLWGDERAYLKDIVFRLRGAGYDVRAAMADTIGAAWAVCHYGRITPLVNAGEQAAALYPLPSAALRLPPETVDRLRTLGLYRIGQFATMPRSALRRRFGEDLLTKLDRAMGQQDEIIEYIHKPEGYQERLPCLEPIVTAAGIEIALRRLLENICKRLQKEGKGLRAAIFSGFRVDNKIQQIEIGTSRPSNDVEHLFKLFEQKIQTIEPDLGIELFMLDALKIEEARPLQETLWASSANMEDRGLSQLVDKLEGKFGAGTVRRYLPAEHHWPERSFTPAATLQEKPAIPWPSKHPRPPRLLASPQPIEVTAPIPDYPPMLFRYKGILHKIKKADGPERVEREWWIEEGQHRDYYSVEDEQGQRYWLFRSGHYDGEKTSGWFLHGYFE